MDTATTFCAAGAETPAALRARTVMGALRIAVGASCWVSPRHGAAVFAPGLIAGSDPAAMAVGRLFAVRDLVLGAAVHHRDPAVRRAALAAGLIVDTADTAAAAIAARRGAPRLAAAAVGAGAAVFVVCGVTALAGTADHS